MADLSRSSVSFNAIYILESVEDGDFRSGQDLYDSIVFPAKFKLGEVHIEYARVNTAESLVAKLRSIALAARQANHRPIVQLEAHGFETGVQLGDGTWLPWATIIPELVEINIASRLNLTFVATSCKGWNLTASLMPSDRAPVCVVVGPPDDMRADELLQRSKKFYGTLVETLDLGAAWSAMNDGLDYSQWKIKPGIAEILFCRVFRQYKEEQDAAARTARENTIVAEVTRARGLDVRQSAMLRERVRADLADFRAQFNRMKHRFFMLDLYPDNATRFGLTFDLCVQNGD